MRFSAIDAITLENEYLNLKKEKTSFFSFIRYSFSSPQTKSYEISFKVPRYLYMRATTLCEDIEEELDEVFNIEDLAEILYLDFLEFVKLNEINAVYKKVRDAQPAEYAVYQNNEIKSKSIREGYQVTEKITTPLPYRMILKGEFLLHDMLEVYPKHTFTLEKILEILFIDYIEEYRMGHIEQPIENILKTHIKKKRELE